MRSLSRELEIKRQILNRSRLLLTLLAYGPVNNQKQDVVMQDVVMVMPKYLVSLIKSRLNIIKLASPSPVTTQSRRLAWSKGGKGGVVSVFFAGKFDGFTLTIANIFYCTFRSYQ